MWYWQQEAWRALSRQCVPTQMFWLAGAALEEGLTLTNLTESQFGIGSRVARFRGIYPAPMYR